MANAPKQETPKKGSRSLKPLLVFLIGVGVWKLPYAAVLGLGLIPSGVAWLVDRDKAKLTALTVAALNVAALMPVLMQVWDSGGTMSSALDLMRHPLTWVLILFGVMAGWFLAQVVPALVVRLIMARERGQANRMKERQRQLVEEWGPAVAEGVEPASASTRGKSGVGAASVKSPKLA